MKKAVSKKQTSQVRKTTKKSNTFEFGVFDLAIPPNITEPKNLKDVRTKWIPFGKDNLFPQYLAELKRKSSTQRSVLAQKTVFTSGAKFVCRDESLEKFIEDINADHESLRDVFKKLADDYYTFGNAYMECVRYEGGVNIYHIDACLLYTSDAADE